MIRRLCGAAGCYDLVDPPRVYCARHQGYEDARLKRQAERATQRWDSHHKAHEWSWVYRDPRWRRLRAEHITLEPCCRRCGSPGDVVDHITPHRGDEALAFDPGNLQTLCARCDARKTREDRQR